MPAKPQPITDAELAIVKLVWERPAVTAAAIRRELYPAGSPSDHGTVQKLLQRLEAKGFLARDRSTWPHTFRALVSQADLAGRQLDALAEKLTEGSLVPFLLHAVRREKLTPAERAEILRILERRK